MFNNYEQTGISSEMQNHLADIQENQEIISGKYIKNKLNPNFTEMVKRLFPGQEERFKLLNGGTYLGGLIDDKISSYTGTPEDKLSYRIDYDKIIETLLTTGFLYLKAFSTQEKGWQFEAIDGHKYYYDGVTEYFIEQYKVETNDDLTGKIQETKYYLYVQTFSNNILTNKLFEIINNNLSIGIPVSLDLIPELAGRPEQIIITEFDKIVFSIKLEYSLIEKVKSLIYSIERKWAEADKQFQNYMEQFIVLKNIEIPGNAKKVVNYGGIQYTVTDFDKLGKILETDADNGDGSLEIIKNGNDLIKEALDFSERQIRQISAITDIPPVFLGLYTSEGNDSGTTITKSSGSFYKRIERYRTGIENIFWDIQQVLGKEKFKYSFVWPSIITADQNETVDIEIKKLEAGLTSRKRAIMTINGFDDKEAQAVIDEINLEKNITNEENNEDYSKNTIE